MTCGNNECPTTPPDICYLINQRCLQLPVDTNNIVSNINALKNLTMPLFTELLDEAEVSPQCERVYLNCATGKLTTNRGSLSASGFREHVVVGTHIGGGYVAGEFVCANIKSPDNFGCGSLFNKDFVQVDDCGNPVWIALQTGTGYQSCVRLARYYPDNNPNIFKNFFVSNGAENTDARQWIDFVADTAVSTWPNTGNLRINPNTTLKTSDASVFSTPMQLTIPRDGRYKFSYMVTWQDTGNVHPYRIGVGSSGSIQADRWGGVAGCVPPDCLHSNGRGGFSVPCLKKGDTVHMTIVNDSPLFAMSVTQMSLQAEWAGCCIDPNREWSWNP